MIITNYTHLHTNIRVELCRKLAHTLISELRADNMSVLKDTLNVGTRRNCDEILTKIFRNYEEKIKRR